MEVLKCYDKVLHLLTEDERCRNSDRVLQARIWYDEATAAGAKTIEQYLNLFVAGKLTNPESIRRTRQKITNEKFPHLASDKVREERRQEELRVRENLGCKTSLFE